MNNDAGNRYNPNVRLDRGLKNIAADVREVDVELTPEQQQLAQLSLAVTRISTSFDLLRKQLVPKLMEVEVGFGTSSDAVTPRLAVDLPINVTMLQMFHATVNPGGVLHLYDQDGARKKLSIAIASTQAGPLLLPAQGIMFKKNLSLRVENDTGGNAPPYPLYVIVQGVAS